MDDIRLGARCRALRHRLGLRQQDVATRAGVTQDDVSRIERGRIGALSSNKVRRVAAALEADVLIVLRWRGGDLDRLLDEAHATLVGRVASMLRANGWQVRLEVSYSVYGERGSIDVLAWHEASSALLVIEVKSELTSVEETLRKHDAKVRLAPRIALEELGWRLLTVGRLLVLPGLATPRRRVARHASVLQVAYPARGPRVRSWLRNPTGAMAGILFVSAHDARSAIARRRIRCRRAA